MRQPPQTAFMTKVNLHIIDTCKKAKTDVNNGKLQQNNGNEAGSLSAKMTKPCSTYI